MRKKSNRINKEKFKEEFLVPENNRVCRICGISGPTKCTIQFNCLNVSMEEERAMNRAKLN